MTQPTWENPVLPPGADLRTPDGPPVVPADSPPPPAALAPEPETEPETRRLIPRTAAKTGPVCLECGGLVDEGYCLTCGAKAPLPRDHLEAQPAAWVAGVSDRGVRHHRNEDALALWALPEAGSRAVLVVCDGVSTSADSDVASLAAAEKARDLLSVTNPQGLGNPVSREAARATALTSAAKAANDAVLAKTPPAAVNAPACTFVAALIDGQAVHAANIGDSRVYWIGDSGSAILTLDDSVAQDRITLGVPRKQAETSPGAHAITKWLGHDAPEIAPRIATFTIAEPGWIVVCSDGLWNYASAADDLADQVRAAQAESSEPLAVARALVRWANDQGGQDNVTVALARFPTTLPSTPEITED